MGIVQSVVVKKDSQNRNAFLDSMLQNLRYNPNMPYLYAHALHGLSARERFNQEAFSIASAHGDAFKLGLYGPDVYFGDRLPPPLLSPHQKELGNRLHGMDGAVLFKKLFCLSCRDDRAFAYALGVLCHFMLDHNMHPYIESQYTGNSHTRFEMRQDLIIRSRAENPALLAHPNALYDTDRAVRMADTLMTSLFSDLFAVNTFGVYRRSYQKWRRVQSLCYDPAGKKRPFVRAAERLLGKPEWTFTGFLLTIDPAETRDLFNEAHQTWRAPWEKDRPRTESYFELFEQAVARAAEAVNAALSGRPYGDFDQALALVKNRSMDGRTDI